MLPSGVARAGFLEHDVVLDGVRHHYVAGQNTGPPVVLVPGQSMSWQSYQKVLPLLAKRFRVFAIDVRGHGQSEHTPGQYTFTRCGRDLAEFLRVVVKEPAICCGNSSGGLIAMWAGAHAPPLVRAVLAEDPPLFSAEWPRMRDDTWVHSFFQSVVDKLEADDVAGFFAQLTIPQQGKVKLMSFPRPLAWLLGGAIRRRQRRHPGAPVDISWLPLPVRLFVRGLTEYDVDFTRACLDGSMCDMDHGAVLSKIACPMLLIRAHSFRHPKLGLVGAMGDEDIARARTLKADLVIEHWPKPHIVHLAAPRAYVRALEQLAIRCT